MATVKARPSVPAVGTHPAHQHACERCHGLYMRVDGGECSLADHGTPNENGIVSYGYCDAVCYRGDRPFQSREGRQVAEGSES
ncbi:MAG TPA: hypothetical protein VIH91_09230 [Terriglobales bacterium]